jgi:hypothetical protein
MECGGKPSDTKQNYIFGYGSLIEDESRMRTTPSARYAWPANVGGIRRGWWARGDKSGLTTTYLGALDDLRSACNGVIYPVSAQEIAATDQRESAGYKRCEIPFGQIVMLDGRSQPPDGVFWAYINLIPPDQLDDNLPSPQFPMVQSYVDICINGCLEVEGKYSQAAGFTQQFIELTDAWSRYWVNDRLYPRRPFIFQPSASKIDAALQAAPKTAELFYEVEIEPASWEDRKPVRPHAAAAASQPAAKRGPGSRVWQSGG